MPVTLKDIAAAAGTSLPTASDVLNGRWRSKGISARLAERVKQAAAARHYRPNRLVRALQTGRTQTLGLILPQISGVYFPRIAAGVENEAKRHGYHLLISHVERGIEDEADEIGVLLEHRVDGLILVPRAPEPNRANYRRLIAQGVPLVFVDGYCSDVSCPAVVGADENGMRAATEHLIALGHRRIGCVGETRDNEHMRDRLNGFRHAMKSHRLPCGSLLGATPDELGRALRASDRPSALAAMTDYAGLMVLRAAAAMHLDVPRDLALTGFSDCLEDQEHYRVPMTSVRVDLEEMGRLAMLKLLEELDHNSNRHSLTRVAAQLVVRVSCGGQSRNTTKEEQHA
ncbi:MAG: LacI family DNA-binding transcriptional regulator [Kiritimatiellae bacterium]|nr:LacI family DNA-binding transcriptional regulator [Kiritimatiellia bacterium]